MRQRFDKYAHPPGMQGLIWLAEKFFLTDSLTGTANAWRERYSALLTPRAVVRKASTSPGAVSNAVTSRTQFPCGPSHR